MAHSAVVFDLGGVVMSSPMDAFRAYEERAGLPHRFISEVVLSGGDDGAFSRLERGELSMEEFHEEFAHECARAGETVDVPALFAEVGAGSEPRPEMLQAIALIRSAGLKAAALTNNWRADGGQARDGSTTAGTGSPLLADVFDVVVESAVVGLRKPDPRIYELVCERLGVVPRETVFLDDLGANLKPARALGMTTIKVTDPEMALIELEAVLGFGLGVS